MESDHQFLAQKKTGHRLSHALPLFPGQFAEGPALEGAVLAGIGNHAVKHGKLAVDVIGDTPALLRIIQTFQNRVHTALAGPRRDEHRGIRRTVRVRIQFQSDVQALLNGAVDLFHDFLHVSDRFSAGAVVRKVELYP